MTSNKKSKLPAKSSQGLEKLRTIISILEDSELAELSYEDSELSVHLAKYAGAAAPAPLPIPVASANSAAASPEGPAVAVDEDLHIVHSPFVGTFYRSPSPDRPPFTDVGKSVSKGGTLCIVEAMKLMNEIDSEVDGTIVEILVENSSPVQYGEPLFKIKAK